MCQNICQQIPRLAIFKPFSIFKINFLHHAFHRKQPIVHFWTQLEYRLGGPYLWAYEIQHSFVSSKILFFIFCYAFCQKKEPLCGLVGGSVVLLPIKLSLRYSLVWEGGWYKKHVKYDTHNHRHLQCLKKN